jgi:ATP-binding cassette subfamily F protein uup
MVETLLSVSDLHLSYGQKTLLDGVSFGVERGKKVGLVGRNGSGKSTLLKILAGITAPDGGKITHSKYILSGYLSQEFELDESQTVLENIISPYRLKQQQTLINGFDTSQEPAIFSDVELEEQARKLIRDFQCPAEDMGVKHLSGGEKRRVALCATLIGSPSLLLLDEPTNHLDILAIEKLEAYVKAFQGAVVLISHDRYFLDSTVDELYELDRGSIFIHAGNYTEFLINKMARLENEQVQIEKTKKYLARERKWVMSGVKARGTKDKGRVKRYYELKHSQRQAAEGGYELLLPEIKELGNKILKAVNLGVDAGSKQVVRGLNLDFQPGMKLGLIGPNGAGKTTLLQVLMGNSEPCEGKVVVGINTEFNYLDQSRVHLDDSLSIFEEVGGGNEKTKFGDGEVSTRGYLRRFLFDNQRIMTPLRFLSGGEKARVILAKLLKKGGNFLIFDEPTNDLDLEMMEVLEETLLEFEGSAVIVSHDRYFLNNVCTDILALQGDGEYVLSTGNYDDYLEKQRSSHAVILPQNLHISKSDPYVKSLNKQKKEIEAKKKNIEKRIAELEGKIEEMEQEFSRPDFYEKHGERLEKFTQKLEAFKVELDRCLEKWMEIV